MTGNSDVSECTLKSTSSLMGCKIDKSLTVAQASMAFINQIDTADNPNIAAQVERAKLFAGAGGGDVDYLSSGRLCLWVISLDILDKRS